MTGAAGVQDITPMAATSGGWRSALGCVTRCSGLFRMCVDGGKDQ